MTQIAQGRTPAPEEIQSLTRGLLEDPVQTAILGIPAGQTAEDVVRERVGTMQKAWPAFSAWWREYLKTDQVPTGSLWRVYIPLSQWIVEQKRRVRPDGLYVMGVYGPQGRGKTVLSRALVPVLNALLTEEEGQAAARATDDYYLGKGEREALKPLGYDAGPRVSNRGPPGTHNLSWIVRNLQEMEASTPESRIEMGNFDKKADDQPAEPFVVQGKVGVFLLDGWFTGANTHFDLSKVPAGLKRAVAERLQQDFRPLFNRMDALWAFDTPSVEEIEGNRQQQEDLLEQREGRRGMTREAIHRFVTYFYRDSWDWESTSPVPRLEDVSFLASIDANRRFVSLQRGGRPDDWRQLSDVSFLSELIGREFEPKPGDTDVPAAPAGSTYAWRINRYFVGRIDRRGEPTEQVTAATLGKDVYAQDTDRYLTMLQNLFPTLRVEQKSYSFPESDAFLEHGVRRTGTHHRDWISVDKSVVRLLAQRGVGQMDQIDSARILRVEEGRIVGIDVERLVEALSHRTAAGPSAGLGAGLEERVDVDGALQRVREGMQHGEFRFLTLYGYDGSGRLAESSATSLEALESEFQANNSFPSLRRDLQPLLEQADDRVSLVLTKNPQDRAFYLMPARNRPEEERLRDEARILLDEIAGDLAIAWDLETLQGTSEWDFPVSTGLLQPYGGVFGISWEEFYALLKEQKPFPILRSASDFVPLDRLIWWVEGEQASLAETEKRRNRPLPETQQQAQLLWLAALHLLDHLAARGSEAPIPEDLLQGWIGEAVVRRGSPWKVTIPERKIRSFADRTRVLFAEVVESLRQPPSTTVDPSVPSQAGLEEAPSVREVLLVGRRYVPPPVEWSSVADKRRIRLSVAANLKQARNELKGMRRRSLFGVTYGVVIHSDVALASQVKAFIREEINPDGRNPSETVPVTLLFSWVPEGPELAEIVALKDRDQINEYGGGGDGTVWSEAGVEGILRGMSQVVQKDLQLAKESRPKIELDAGLEELEDTLGRPLGAGLEEGRRARGYDPVEVAGRLLGVLVEEGASGKVVLNLSEASGKLGGSPVISALPKNSALLAGIHAALSAALGKRRPTDARLGLLWEKFHGSKLSRVRIEVGKRGRPQLSAEERLVRQQAGQRLRNLRQRLGLSQTGFSRRLAQLGYHEDQPVTRQLISAWEKGNGAVAKRVVDFLPQLEREAARHSAARSTGLAAGLEELPATAAERMPAQGEAAPRASARRSAVGYVVDAGVGVIRSRLELNTPYWVVAEGLEQVRLLREMEVSADRIVVLVQDQAEKEELIAAAFPGDNILTAEGFSDWSDARRYAWRVASDWLSELEQVEVTALRTSARTVLGLLAQMKELLPLGWQRDDMLTAETAEQILLLYQLGA